MKNKVFGESMIFDIKPWSPINAEVHSLKWTPMTTKTDYFYYILVNKLISIYIENHKILSQMVFEIFCKIKS